MKSGLLATVCACLALSACGGADELATESALTPMPPTLPGMYAGVFPCSNCAAIDAVLWLREDYGFVFRQRYLSESGAPDGPDAFAIGQWQWDETRAELALRTAGPERRFRLVAEDRLEWLVAASAPHLLQRDVTAPPLSESMPVKGVAVVTGAAATFRECLSQIERAVATDAGLAELRRQHRAFSPRGRPALTSVYAHLGRESRGEAASEVWAIDRVERVNPDETC